MCQRLASLVERGGMEERVTITHNQQESVNEKQILYLAANEMGIWSVAMAPCTLSYKTSMRWGKRPHHIIQMWTLQLRCIRSHQPGEWQSVCHLFQNLRFAVLVRLTVRFQNKGVPSQAVLVVYFSWFFSYFPIHQAKFYEGRSYVSLFPFCLGS